MDDQVNSPGVQTKRPDPGTQLPEAVKRAATRAAELSEAQRTGKLTPSPTGVQMVISDVSSQTPPIPERPTSELTTTAPIQSGGVATPPVTPRSNIEREHTADDFKAMQGRWERSEQEKRDLSKRVAEMQRLVAVMGQLPPPADSRVAPITPKIYIKPEEVKEFGADFMDMVGRR